MRVDGINSVLSSIPYVEVQPVSSVARERGEQPSQVRKEKLTPIDTISVAKAPHFTIHTRPTISTLSASEQCKISLYIKSQMQRRDFIKDFPGLCKV